MCTDFLYKTNSLPCCKSRDLRGTMADEHRHTPVRHTHSYKVPSSNPVSPSQLHIFYMKSPNFLNDSFLILFFIRKVQIFEKEIARVVS